MNKTLKYIIPLVILAVLAFLGWQFYRYFQRPEEIEVLPSRPGDVKEMVRLCSMEIYNEVPVLDTVNFKVMFAVQKQSGSISFDIEHLNVDDSGDTVRIQLPREIVEVNESTEKNSWQVIDTKAIGPMAILRSNKFSLEEENRVKAKLKANSIKRLYSNGTVRQARKDAVDNLTRLMEAAYRKPVIVTDPTPEGNLH
ncbi:MAG: tetratricopeptide repeat protein [Muribaculaceae bacterium]|nr:tetratricopeptide repeat protein [Muribaculaceae bacterium]